MRRIGILSSAALAAALMAGGAGLMATHEPAAVNGPRISAWRKTKHKGDASRDPNGLDAYDRRKLVAGSTKHLLCAGAVRNKKKLASGIPRGYVDIGINGIRGASGGGREPGGACVTLCKRKQRTAKWGRAVK